MTAAIPTPLFISSLDDKNFNGGLLIPNLASIKLPFSVVEVDTHSAWDATNERFVCPNKGYYRVAVCGGLQADVLQTTYLTLYVNGTSVIEIFAAPMYGTVNASAMVHLNAGDYIEVRIYQQSGGDVYFSGGTLHSQLSIAFTHASK